MTGNLHSKESKKAKIYKKLESKFSFGRELVKISLEEKVDPQLTAAIIMHESKGKIKARGTSGEYGLMQIMPYNMTKAEIKKAYDPSFNIRKGLHIFKRCIKHEMNHTNEYVMRALSCYNAGPNRKNKIMIAYEKAVVTQYLALGE